MKLIALAGLHGAGKDTVADALPARKLAFADTLYEEVAEAFGVTVERLKDRSRKDTPQEALAVRFCKDVDFFLYILCCSESARSPRQIFQWWGDYRRAQDPDYFVRALQDRTLLIENSDFCNNALTRLVITDVRFPNEAAMVRQLGGQVWQVVRPGHEPPRTGHASETTGDEFAPDRVLVNDGSLDELRAAALAAWEAV